MAENCLHNCRRIQTKSGRSTNAINVVGNDPDSVLEAFGVCDLSC